jgi:hypothetical protein
MRKKHFDFGGFYAGHARHVDQLSHDRPEEELSTWRAEPGPKPTQLSAVFGGDERAMSNEASIG